MKKSKLSIFKENFITRYKESSHLSKIYVGTFILFILVSYTTILNRDFGSKLLVPFVILFSLVLIYKQRKSGWVILFTHLIMIVIPLVFGLNRFNRIGSVIYPMLAIGVFLFVILLFKSIRELFEIHTREIVISVFGAYIIAIVPKMFANDFISRDHNVQLVMSNIGYLFAVLLIVLLIRRLPPIIYSNWNSYLEGLEYDSSTYYTELQELLQTKKVEGIGYSRVMLRKRGAFSSKREYLRVTFEDLVYDISFYPYSLGTFASAWNYSTVTGIEAFVISIPWIGEKLHRMLFPDTYYIADTRAMFQMLVHEAQLEIIDKLTTQKGLRKLSDKQRVLNTKSIFDRK